MFTLTIKRADGSEYWVEHFNDEPSAGEWLAVEKTRPYWESDFTSSLQESAPVVLTPDEQIANERMREYLKEGVTTDALAIALWEKVVENRPQAADALQAKRELVKARVPKPVR